MDTGEDLSWSDSQEMGSPPAARRDTVVPPAQARGEAIFRVSHTIITVCHALVQY